MRFAQEVKPAKLTGRWLWMLAAYMVLSFYIFHERSEFTFIFTSCFTSSAKPQAQAEPKAQ